jgi:hypothetical protein
MSKILTIISIFSVLFFVNVIHTYNKKQHYETIRNEQIHRVVKELIDDEYHKIMSNTIVTL